LGLQTLSAKLTLCLYLGLQTLSGPTQGCVTFTNIVLRNIVVDKAVLSPGVILGNSTNPMKGAVLAVLCASFRHKFTLEDG
jgi:hypothetical protein